MKVSDKFLAPDRLTPSGKLPAGARSIGGWVGHREGLDTVQKVKILPLPGLEPQPYGLCFLKSTKNAYHTLARMIL
jgi:hypothetical protein